MSKKIEKRIKGIKRPSKLGGSFIPLGYSRKDLFDRMVMYLSDAFIFSIVYTLLLYLLDGNRLFLIKLDNDLHSIALHMFLSLIFSAITEAVWWENKIKNYHRKIAEIRENA